MKSDFGRQPQLASERIAVPTRSLALLAPSGLLWRPCWTTADSVRYEEQCHDLRESACLDSSTRSGVGPQ